MCFIVCADVYRDNRVIFDDELQADPVGHVDRDAVQPLKLASQSVKSQGWMRWVRLK